MNLIRRTSLELQNGTVTLYNDHFLPSLPYWIAGALTGLIGALYAQLFRLLTTRATLLYEHHFFLWCALVPVTFVGSFLLVRLISPGAGGAGIPQVMAALDRIDSAPNAWIRGYLGFRMILIKLSSSALIVVGGGAVGREGPTIQIGSSLFLQVEDYFLRRGWISRKNPLASRRAFILAGGAAGIAAAFNTPLGGIVFAIEELASDSFKQFRTTVLTGVIVAGLTAQAISGSYLYLVQPSLRAIDLASVGESALIGLLAGAGGAIFGKLLFRFALWRKRNRGIRREILLVFLLSIAFVALGTISHGTSLGTGSEGIGVLLFREEQATSLQILIRFVSTQLSYLIGASGGVFAPALSIGAHMGSVVSAWVPAFQTHAHLLILVGMAAFLTGVTHAPFTSMVLVLEMTDRSNAIFALMVGTLLGAWIARLLDPHSFYERMRVVFAETAGNKEGRWISLIQGNPLTPYSPLSE